MSNCLFSGIFVLLPYVHPVQSVGTNNVPVERLFNEKNNQKWQSYLQFTTVNAGSISPSQPPVSRNEPSTRAHVHTWEVWKLGKLCRVSIEWTSTRKALPSERSQISLVSTGDEYLFTHCAMWVEITLSAICFSAIIYVCPALVDGRFIMCSSTVVSIALFWTMGVQGFDVTEGNWAVRVTEQWG
jgi:hypothetical protein